MDRSVSVSKTRQRILRAALEIFADRGYAAASVQSIVDAARVTKPTLYYYFESKAGLFQALLDWAHDERFERMQAAAGRATGLRDQLVEIWAALFEFTQGHRALMRIAFATAFASRGELPTGVRYLEKSQRNFEFLHGLIRSGQASGELDRGRASRDLAMGLWGMMSIRVMSHLVESRGRLTRREAEKVVQLFLDGASPPGRDPAALRNRPAIRSTVRPAIRSTVRLTVRSAAGSAAGSGNGRGRGTPKPRAARS